MDATNLAMCFTPNLVSGSNILRDTQMCSVPHSSPATAPVTAVPADFSKRSASQRTTLGVIIKVCIEQYFEIFEELPDRTTAMSSHPSISFSLPYSSSTPSTNSTLYSTPLDGNTLGGSHLDPPQKASSRAPISPSSAESMESFKTAEDSDSDPDESMLIMPVGLSSPTSLSSHGAGLPSSPPTAWTSPANLHRSIGIGHPSSPLSNHSHRLRDSALSSSSFSTRGPSQSTHESHRGVLRPARSMISIERGVSGTRASGGSICIGRGAGGTRGAGGAGVEAIGITAAGFFSPIGVQEEARAANKATRISSQQSANVRLNTDPDHATSLDLK
jgi:Rho GTPase-activating protein 1